MVFFNDMSYDKIEEQRLLQKNNANLIISSADVYGYDTAANNSHIFFSKTQ